MKNSNEQTNDMKAKDVIREILLAVANGKYMKQKVKYVEDPIGYLAYLVNLDGAITGTDQELQGFYKSDYTGEKIKDYTDEALVKEIELSIEENDRFAKLLNDAIKEEYRVAYEEGNLIFIPDDEIFETFRMNNNRLKAAIEEYKRRKAGK